jgi:hypothetical protein
MAVIVWVTDTFYGFHRWKDAPSEVEFLRDFHRHLFHVKVGMAVKQLDREIEFFLLKADLAMKLEDYQGQQFEKSCEMIATEILECMGAEFVEVSEDGENGATVTWGNPAWETKGKCFVGIEAEGPWRGRQTLFVPGSASPERVSACLRKYEVACVYYGAGNDRNLRHDTLDTICREAGKRGMDAVVEVDETTFNDGWTLLDDMSWAIVIGVGVSGYDYLKTCKDDRIIWEDLTGRCWLTSTRDPYFQTDLYVE